MNNNLLIATIVIGASSVLLFNPLMNKLNYFVYLFAVIGLGLFTMAGIQKGINNDFSIFICISLGTISATFGGLIRDLITGEQPMLLTRKEIYALAGASGGVLFFVLKYFNVPDEVNIPLTIVVIFLIRHLTHRYGIKLPTYDEERGWTVKD